MEPILNEQQSLLRDSFVRLCKDLGGPKRARQLRNQGSELDADAWQGIARAGWLATPVAENECGLGMGLYELSLAMEEAGRQLLMVPLAEAAATVWALTKSEPGNMRSDALKQVLEGSRLLVPALPQAGWGCDEGPPLNARVESQRVVLDGVLRFVSFAQSADVFLAVAQDTNRQHLLCLVPRDANRVSVAAVPNVDGSTSSELSFNAVSLTPGAVLARADKARELTTGLRDVLALGVSAQLLGVSQAALDMSLEHIRFRQQFGKPLGSFQALQHRAASCFVDIELNRSLVYRVFSAWDAGQCQPAMVSAAKARTSRVALEVTRAALQMHGAIGYTDEHDIGLYYKRALALAALYGNELNQTTRFSKLTMRSA